jgi:hypothetical protein
MTKLRFIKPWGPYKPGDLHEPKNANTIHMLVDVYKFAVIEPDNPIATAEPTDITTDTTIPKYLRRPGRNKMMQEPQGAKSKSEK